MQFAADRPNFYDAVYQLAAQLPPGQVTTYGQIARWLVHPSAARAVGYALHALPSGTPSHPFAISQRERASQSYVCVGARGDIGDVLR